MIVRKLLTFLLLLILNHGFSSPIKIEWFRNSNLDDLSVNDFLQLRTTIDSINSELEIQPAYYTFIEEGFNRYLLPDNFSYVFKWDGEQFQNLYGGVYHGYNRGSFKWFFKGKIYCYGGWVENQFFSEVIFFDEDLKRWELVGYLGKKPNPVVRQPLFIYNKGEVLYSLLDITEKRFPMEQSTLPVYKKNLFEYNQIDRIWNAKKRVQTTNLSSEIDGYINLADYLVFWDTTVQAVYVMEKHTLAFKKVMDPDLFNVNTKFLREQSFVVYNNDIRFFASGNLSKVYDVKEIFQKADSIQYLNSKKYTVIILIIISLGVPLYYLGSKRGQLNKLKSSFPYPSLLAHKGKIINQEELDNCIGVSKEISAHTKRNRRSKILKILNSPNSPVQVERVRNFNDSRVFSYKIT